MLRSIATVSVSGTLVEKLKAISRAGFDGVEIFENDLLYFDGSPADVKRICADLGLQSAQALPASTDLPQQFGACAADLFRSPT